MTQPSQVHCFRLNRGWSGPTALSSASEIFCTFQVWTAAESGSIETLEWLRSSSKGPPRKERCPWDVRVCAEAARHGHLELLVWARKRKCKWDERTCLLAAHSGHLHVLKWARSRGARMRAPIRRKLVRNSMARIKVVIGERPFVIG